LLPSHLDGTSDNRYCEGSNNAHAPDRREFPVGIEKLSAAGDEQRYTERDFPIELIYTLCKKIWISNRFVKSEEIEQ
jgi:hypothetical protein